MNAYTPLLEKNMVPPFAPVAYRLPSGSLTDPAGELVRQLREYRGRIDPKPGATVAIATGSREINGIASILRALIGELKEMGLCPFIVPAMGSHGGATARGQREIIESYGITEEAMGVSIRSSMETVEIGHTESGLPVRIDRHANEADYILPVNRVKPHTDFRGGIESGVMKLMAIGLGKQHGASICHGEGFDSMSENVIAIAREILSAKKILFGVGIVEDAFHNPWSITLLPPQTLEQEEMRLLKEAKSLIPPIPFEKIDVLLVGEMGKNLSGPGMDTNVTGRSLILGVSKPFATCLTVLDLTEKSHHNINGIGCADVTTKRLIDKMDTFESYPNAITTRDPLACKLPMFMPNDFQAIQLSIHLCNLPDGREPSIVFIKNTLEMNRFYITGPLLDEAARNPALTVLGEPEELPFDASVNLIPIELQQLDFWRNQ